MIDSDAVVALVAVRSLDERMASALKREWLESMLDGVTSDEGVLDCLVASMDDVTADVVFEEPDDGYTTLLVRLSVDGEAFCIISTVVHRYKQITVRGIVPLDSDVAMHLLQQAHAEMLHISTTAHAESLLRVSGKDIIGLTSMGMGPNLGINGDGMLTRMCMTTLCTLTPLGSPSMVVSRREDGALISGWKIGLTPDEVVTDFMDYAEGLVERCTGEEHRKRYGMADVTLYHIGSMLEWMEWDTVGDVCTLKCPGRADEVLHALDGVYGAKFLDMCRAGVSMALSIPDDTLAMDSGVHSIGGSTSIQ